MVAYIISYLPAQLAGSRNIINLTTVDIFDTPTIRSPPITVINLQANVTKNMTNFRINGIFTIRSKTGVLESALYHRTINACVFFKEPSSNYLLQMIQQIPNKCPVTATMYFIRNASFANARIPSFLENLEKLILATYWFGMLRNIKGL